MSCITELITQGAVCMGMIIVIIKAHNLFSFRQVKISAHFLQVSRTFLNLVPLLLPKDFVTHEKTNAELLLDNCTEIKKTAYLTDSC